MTAANSFKDNDYPSAQKIYLAFKDSPPTDKDDPNKVIYDNSVKYLKDHPLGSKNGTPTGAPQPTGASQPPKKPWE